jgi:diguanylate cyclase (GGDEF)-like protein
MADAKEKVLAQLRALRAQYAAELPNKLQQLRSIATRLNLQWDDELFRTLHRQTHSLTGSGATFGYADLSHAARDLELLLKTILESGVGSQHPGIKQIDGLLAKLERAGKIPASSTATAEPAIFQPRTQRHSTDPDKRLIFVVDDDTNIAHEQCLQYELHGYKVREFHEFSGLQAAIKKDQPLAIIMDVVFPEGDLAGIEKIIEIRQSDTDFPPVIFVSQREDLEARLASVRAGTAAYITKPIDLSNMIETLDRLTTVDLGAPYRILIIDDDASMAYHNALMLQRAGMETEVITEPGRLLDVLPVFQPELILMDLYLPGCTGIELAAVIRQHEAYVGTPIVFFSVETDISKHLAAMRAGGDDFLIKPIAPDHLLATVESRVQRARTITSFMIRDSLTGLLNHTAIEEQLERELGLQQRHDGVLSYALIDLDHFKQVNDHYGHAAGDKVIRGLSRLLRQRFRQTDLLGRYGGEEFVVVLPASDATLAARLLEEVRNDFSRIQFTAADKAFTVSFSAGIASAPPYNSAFTLQEEADRALYRAKQAGRNQILIAKSH